MDRSATAVIPLLRDYTPGFPLDNFEGLLLARRDDIARLLRAEQYCLQRSKSAKQPVNYDAWWSFGTDDCFSCRYFQQSPTHQKLFDEIQEQARKDKEAKLDELRRLKQRYKDLMQLHGQASCEYYDTTDRWGDRVTHHSYSCRRCRYRDEAHGLSITVHEWPLPTNQLQAWSTVFELDPPSAFQAWRNATVHFFGDILRRHDADAKIPNFKYVLRKYGGLQRWHKVDATLPQRIFPLSETKPHLGTHRRDRRIVDLDETDVCLNNGLIWEPFDDVNGTLMMPFQESDYVHNVCTIELPLRSATIKSFLLRDSRTLIGKSPNQSIARQSLCPDHFALGEGKALMSLSHGHEIRWLALLSHLASPQIDFSKPETATFVLQICLRAGPNRAQPSQVQRQSQDFLTDKHFATQLSHALNARIGFIEKNPEMYLSLWCFTVMAAKALTMNSHHQPAFLGLLARCRETAYQWAVRLCERSLTADNDGQRMQFREMMFAVALVCMDTFSMDIDHLEDTLRTRAGSILIEMAILVRDNAELRKPVQESELESFLFDRWSVIIHRSSAIVRRLTLSANSGMLDLAIRNCWAAYSPDEAWHCVPAAEYWLETRSKSLQVLYNTMTGELLVNGSPLSRLPASYKSHPLYPPLFGRTTLDVMPSFLPGMSFSGKNTFQGYEVRFGMQSAVGGAVEDDLLLLVKHHGSTYDLVPSHTLRGHLPETLVQSFVHWYNHTRDEIELRQLSSPWARDQSEWKLKRHDGAWVLTRGNEHMIGPSTATALLIANLLAPLDTVMHLHMIYCKSTEQLAVRLPRLKLDFDLDKTSRTLQSQQFPGMQINADQSIGTLVGLRNRLVLKDPKEAKKRVVLVPQGDIEFSMSQHGHINVSVAFGTASRVQSYLIDSRLGRLTDDGTLQSKLFLSYLHALTAYCIPDPFTMHTGTEQALSILESAAVRSWSTLTPEHARLLSEIAALTPGRAFYPKDLRVMQTVTWDSKLSMLAQPGRFRILADEILQDVRRVRFLYPQQDVPSMKFRQSDLYLMEREAIRSAGLYVAGFGADAFITEHDSHYRSRDLAERSEEALRSVRVVAKTMGRCQFIDKQTDHMLLTELHDTLSLALGNMASVHEPILEAIRFDKEWLEAPDNSVSELWCRLHYALGHLAERTSRYHVATWLATMAYSKENVQQIVSVLYALATITNVGGIALPEVEQYSLKDGYAVDQSWLKGVIRDGAKSISQCPESRIPKQWNETNRQAANRREQIYTGRLGSAIGKFLGHLVPQWPCLEPHRPQANGDIDIYINVSKVLSRVKPRWKIWHHNLLVYQYLEKIASAMGQQEVRAPAAIPPCPKQPLPEAPNQGRQRGFVDVTDLFQRGSQGSNKVPRIKLDITVSAAGGRGHEFGLELQEIVNDLEVSASSEYQRRYLADLRFSNSSADEEQHAFVLNRPFSCTHTTLGHHQRRCKEYVDRLYTSLVEDTGGNAPSTSGPIASSAASEIHTIIRGAKSWPRTSPLFFLSQLRRDRWSALPHHWKQKIAAFGLAVTELQRADRLLRATGNETDLVKELRNVGHEDWNPQDHPE